MKIALIAPEGMLGRAWVELLEREQVSFVSRSFPEIDITQNDSVASFLEAGITDVINCAAYTDVDGAETNETEATRINGEGSARLAERCAAIGATLVHYSTDYVFAGDATAPYPVDAPRAPLNAYGRSKAVGEEAIAKALDAHLILRTSWLYAPWANNFVLTMKKLGQTKDALRVVDDQRGRPTSAQHLAATSLALLRKDARGILHATDGGECTWFDLASYVVSKVRPDGGCVVSPCGSDEYPRPAPRPAYSVLDLAPTEALVGPMPSWQSNVDAVLAKHT